jgi:heme exporter protein C
MREKLTYAFGIAGTLLMLWNLHTIFMVLPDEAAQGAIGRMIFIHVPAAISAYCFYTAAVVTSVAFLIRRNFLYDSISVACIEVGTMLTLVNLVTGSLWGKVIWGVWWAWDLRMTTQLMCFLLYLGYLLLRPAVSEPTQRGVMSAIVAIFAFADIPIVVMAIRFKDVRTQHPSPVLETGGLDPTWVPPFVIGIFAVLLIGISLVMVRLHQENTQREMDSLRRELHAL